MTVAQYRDAIDALRFCLQLIEVPKPILVVSDSRPESFARVVVYRIRPMG